MLNIFIEEDKTEGEENSYFIIEGSDLKGNVCTILQARNIFFDPLTLEKILAQNKAYVEKEGGTKPSELKDI